MSNETTSPIGKYRWTICALLFFATTINYIDRQILALVKEHLDKEMGWSNETFGAVNSAFQGAYAVGLLAFGWFVDKFGTKVGYAVSLIAWSLAACAHGLVGSIRGFFIARIALGLGEGGNFPSAIKATALWFPKRERAFATSLFNAGTNVGALLAPAVIPPIAAIWGWRAAFIAAGLAGFLWLFFWIPMYNVPEKIKHLRQDERDHILSDRDEQAADAERNAPKKQGVNLLVRLFSFEGRVSIGSYWGTVLGINLVCFMAGLFFPWKEDLSANVVLLIVLLVSAWVLLANQAKRFHDINCSGWRVLWNLVPVVGSLYTFLHCGFTKGLKASNRHGDQRTTLLDYRQAWAFIVGKFLTDPVWWFFLIWLPDYFKKTRGLDIKHSWIHLVTIYGIVTVLGVYGGWITGHFVKRGWSVTRARKTGMFIFALCVLPILFVTRVDDWPAVASVVGIGGMAGSAGGMMFPIYTGKLLDKFTASGNVTAGYAFLFGICAFAYLLAFGIIHLLAPKFEQVKMEDG